MNSAAKEYAKRVGGVVMDANHVDLNGDVIFVIQRRGHQAKYLKQGFANLQNRAELELISGAAKYLAVDDQVTGEVREEDSTSALAKIATDHGCKVANFKKIA